MNIENLKIHRDWCADNLVDSQLGMGDYSNGDRRADTPEEICGTVACFLGWAPMSLKDKIDMSHGVDYDSLAEEVFNMGCMSDEWEFLFSAGWQEVDSTVEGCIARTDYLIEHGKVPADFDVDDIDTWRVYR